MTEAAPSKFAAPICHTPWQKLPRANRKNPPRSSAFPRTDPLVLTRTGGSSRAQSVPRACPERAQSAPFRPIQPSPRHPANHSNHSNQTLTASTPLQLRHDCDTPTTQLRPVSDPFKTPTPTHPPATHTTLTPIFSLQPIENEPSLPLLQLRNLSALVPSALNFPLHIAPLNRANSHHPPRQRQACRLKLCHQKCATLPTPTILRGSPDAHPVVLGIPQPPPPTPLQHPFSTPSAPLQDPSRTPSAPPQNPKIAFWTSFYMLNRILEHFLHAQTPISTLCRPNPTYSPSLRTNYYVVAQLFSPCFTPITTYNPQTRPNM